MEKQERKSRIILFFAFLSTLISIGLLAGALGSDEWVKSNLIQDGQNTSPEKAGDAFASHGLFKGKAVTPFSVFRQNVNIKINCEFSARICKYSAINPQDGAINQPNMVFEEKMDIEEKCRQTSGAKGILLRPGELNFWIWIVTLIFLCQAILFGVIAAIFTMVNVIYVPISDIAGVRGIYVWNAVACLCTIITLCVWSGLHYSHLYYNMLPVFVLELGVTNCGLTQHGVAVWLCLTALLLFLINIALIRFRRGSPIHKKSRARSYNKGEQITLY